MTIHLPKELEKSIRAEVHRGRFASVDEAMEEAARLLLRQPPPAQKPLTIEELHQQMLANGLITQLPDTAADFDDPDDQLVDIEGEPLSETIIRERR